MLLTPKQADEKLNSFTKNRGVSSSKKYWFYRDMFDDYYVNGAHKGKWKKYNVPLTDREIIITGIAEELGAHDYLCRKYKPFGFFKDIPKKSSREEVYAMWIERGTESINGSSIFEVALKHANKLGQKVYGTRNHFSEREMINVFSAHLWKLTEGIVSEDLILDQLKNELSWFKGNVSVEAAPNEDEKHDVDGYIVNNGFKTPFSIKTGGALSAKSISTWRDYKKRVKPQFYIGYKDHKTKDIKVFNTSGKEISMAKLVDLTRPKVQVEPVVVKASGRREVDLWAHEKEPVKVETVFNDSKWDKFFELDWEEEWGED